MTNDVGSWKFDKNIIFDKHVRQHVPFYEDIHKMIITMSDWFVEDRTNVFDIGTSTGYLIQELVKKHNKKDMVAFIGLDSSIDMINLAHKRLGDACNDVGLIIGDIKDVEITCASYVVSNLTLQFINTQERQEVINKIYNGLNSGGGFVLVEKVLSNTARFSEVFNDMYYDFKLSNGVDEKQIIDKTRAIRGVLKPLTLDDNINMLLEAGFRDIETFFKWGNFAGIVAVK